MLRIETKKKVIRIFDTIEELFKKVENKNEDYLFSALQDIQDAVITVGEQLEKELDAPREIISHLELFCELLYLLSQSSKQKEKYLTELSKELAYVRVTIKNMAAPYQVVFFPYKAEMWDSLESIWIACNENPLCDCKVVPIPYYHFDSRKDKWVYSHEIDKFPEYVPVLDYRDYSLDEKPEAAFIHNPYDQYNYVTRVHSDYYSSNLINYAKKLFYVPYYVKSGFVSPTHKMLPVYFYADYLVVQSESFKYGLRDFDYYNNAIVLGSPKLDRIIRLSKEEKNIPREWNAVIQNKKAVMLNTSLAEFLRDGDAYLQKLAYIFDIVRQREDVALIWRPHPLLQSTIESMRPHLLDVYLDLKKRFEEEEIGVFDDTPDIGNTVAISDAYIGEISSSVTNLFQAVGKPLYTLNNYITAPFEREQCQSATLIDCVKIDNILYCILENHTGIFATSNFEEELEFTASFADCAQWKRIFGALTAINKTVYISPTTANRFCHYDVASGMFKTDKNERDEELNIQELIWNYKNKVFYASKNKKVITEYDVNKKRWTIHNEPILALQKDVTESVISDVYDYAIVDDEVWLTNLYSNRVLCFNMKSSQYQVFEIGNNDMRYSAITQDGQNLYLSNANTGSILVWNLKKKAQERNYTMPSTFAVFGNLDGKKMAHKKLFVFGDVLYAIPNTANQMVKVDLVSGEVSIVAEEFWSDVLIQKNGYKPQAHGVVNFTKTIDNLLYVQRRGDSALLSLDLLSGEYKVSYPEITKKDVDMWTRESDGFEKAYKYTTFTREESKYFPFEEFLDDLVNNRFESAMECQKRATEDMAINMDGTCGEKTCQFMLEVLKKECDE